MRSRIVSRRDELKRPPNPWGPLFQPSLEALPEDEDWLWSVWSDVLHTYLHGIRLPPIMSVEDVIRALNRQGHLPYINLNRAVRDFPVVLIGGVPTTRIKVLDASGRRRLFYLEREKRFTDPRVRKPNPWGPMFQPAARSGSSKWLPFLMPGWSPLLYRVHLPEPPTRGDIETFFHHRYGNSPRDIIFLDEDRIKVVYPREEIILTRFEEMRKANPFGPIFSTGEQPAEWDGTPRMWDVYSPLNAYRKPVAKIRIIFNSPPHPADVYRVLENAGHIGDRSGMEVDFSDLDDGDDPQILVDWYPTSSPPYRQNRFLLLPAGTNRKPNPLGPIFAEGFSHPEEELFRWDLQQPGGSKTHVLLPKYPSYVEIANVLGLDPLDVISFHKFSSDNRRAIVLSNKTYYELNRVC